jgi:muramidase (phage lysozyme)
MIQSLAFVIILLMSFSGVVSGGDYDRTADPLLNRIALGEGTSDAAAQQYGLASAYEITYAYGQYNPQGSKPLTEMTIQEAKQLQQQMLANQAGSELPSSAVGKYQLISKTLAEQQNKLGLSDDIKFDATTQDLFGLSLLEKRGYTDWIEGKISDHDFQKNIAKEWASVADPDTGKSYYGQDVGTSIAQIKDAMAQTKSLLNRTPKKGDHVSINSGFQSNTEGTIKDIGNGLICLQNMVDGKTHETCVGIESIRMLTWIN